MPINYSELERRAAMFNRRYGVNFNVEEFINSTAALDDDMISLSSGKESANMLYRTAFRPLIKKAMENYVDNKILSFEPWTMLREFEANVMSFYRSECEREGVGERAPDVDAGWTQSEYFQRVDRELQGMNPDKKVYTYDKYISGQLRLRDIRKYVESMGNELSEPKVSTIMVYANAVSEAIKSRTRTWRFFHPFKSRAEKRDLKMLKDVIMSKTGSYSLTIGDNPPLHTRGIKRHLDKEPIADVKAAVTEAINTPVQSKPQEEYLYEKPDVKPGELSKDALISADKNKPLEMRDFLKVGYRPDLKNIEQEYKMATPLYDAVVKNGKILSDDSGVQTGAADILMKNYARLRLFKAKADKENGVTEAAEQLLSTMEPIYAAEDQGFINDNPMYVPPEIPAELGRERVEIVFDENKSGPVVDKIDEVSKSEPNKSLG